MAFDVVDHPALVLRHLEEVVLLFDPLEHRLVVGALAVDDLLLRVEALAAEAVVAAVLAEIDLTGVPERLENGGDHRLLADSSLRGGGVGVGPRSGARPPGTGRRDGRPSPPAASSRR